MILLGSCVQPRGGEHLLLLPGLARAHVLLLLLQLLRPLLLCRHRQEQALLIL
jgi:hypothetical protein